MPPFIFKGIAGYLILRNTKVHNVPFRGCSISPFTYQKFVKNNKLLFVFRLHRKTCQSVVIFAAKEKNSSNFL